MKEYTGYHGLSLGKDAVLQCMPKSDFIREQGHGKWFGEGIYLFSNVNTAYHYSRYHVTPNEYPIVATLVVSGEGLDLTTEIDEQRLKALLNLHEIFCNEKNKASTRKGFCDFVVKSGFNIIKNRVTKLDDLSEFIECVQIFASNIGCIKSITQAII